MSIPMPNFTEPTLPFDMYAGTGDYLAISACTDEPRGTRHESLADALNAVERLDSYGCGPGCRSTSRHRAVRSVTR